MNVNVINDGKGVHQCLADVVWHNFKKNSNNRGVLLWNI